MNGFYGKEGFVSTWIGKVESEKDFYDYIQIRGRNDDIQSAFLLGEDFGIMFYDEDCSLVCFLNKETSNLDELLETGAPDYVIDGYKKSINGLLTEKYNCCVMFFEMKYTGELLQTIDSKYGRFTFIGCLEADVMDI